jgi:hypothetical protein
MPVCKLNEDKTDCVFDPNGVWDTLDDESKEKCFHVIDDCRIKEEYMPMSQPVYPDSAGSRRRSRKNRKSRKSRKARKGGKTARRQRRQ